MSVDGVLSEFDPLATPVTAEDTTTAPSDIPHIKQEKDVSPTSTDTSTDTTTSTRSNILNEFDPLTKAEGGGELKVGHSVNQISTSHVQSTIISPSQSSSSHKISSPVNLVPKQPHTGDYIPLGYPEDESTKGLVSSHDKKKSKKHVHVSKDRVDSKSGAGTVSSQKTSDQIGAEISQIDSVLKALNMGQLDLGAISSLTGTPATTQSLQVSQTEQVHTHDIVPYQLITT